jgi:hypothetical protein
MANCENKTVQNPQEISNPISSRFLTLKLAADYQGLSAWAARERVWAGSIPVIHFPGGRKIWIDARDLDIFIEKNKHGYD